MTNRNSTLPSFPITSINDRKKTHQSVHLLIEISRESFDILNLQQTRVATGVSYSDSGPHWRHNVNLLNP